MKNHQLNVTASIATLRKAGWHPLHAELFTGIGPDRLYAEWPSESHARKFATEFAKRAPCTVAYDRDCGWSTELELPN